MEDWVVVEQGGAEVVVEQDREQVERAGWATARTARAVVATTIDDGAKEAVAVDLVLAVVAGLDQGCGARTIAAVVG